MNEDDDDWCDMCGSEGCPGDCNRCTRCGREGCGCPPESPGAILTRQEAQRKAERQQALNDAVERRLLPETTKEATLEAFEQRMAKRPKVEVVQKKDGTHYRKRVG